MNVLFINSAKEWGGNEKWSLYAAHGLAKRGAKVFFGCRNTMFEERSWDKNVSFVKFDLVNQFDIKTIVQIARFCKENKIDIVIPTKQREYFLAGLALFTNKKIKVVARLGIDRPIHNLRNKIVFLYLLDAVIVNSKKICQTLSHTKGFDQNLCRIVYNGVEFPVLSKSEGISFREKIGCRPNEKLIAVVGRLASQKGIDMALCAFAALKEKTPHIRLIVCGDGPSEDEYRKLALTLDIQEKVHFLGFQKDLNPIYQATDIYWLTSRSEGMANSLLEAMSYGKTCIAFDVAGVSELMTDAVDGLIVPFGEMNELANKTYDVIIDRKKFEALGSAARSHVESHFTMDRMYENLEKTLVQVMNAK